jgi:outer membrane protein assembly factor BamB
MDSATGSVKWSFPWPLLDETSARSSSPALTSDGSLYMGAESGFLALNANGTLKWSIAEDDGPVHSSPAVGPDGTIYVGAPQFRFDAPGLMALNPDGTEKWTFPTGGFVGSSPAVGDDGTIYVGSNDHTVYAVNPDGTLKWSFPTGGSIGRSSLAVGRDGTVFVGSRDQRFYAINPDGTLKWALETGINIDRSSPVVAADGTIYDVLQQTLVAISPDGVLEWTSDGFFSQFGDEGAVSTVALGADGTLYVVSRMGKLFAIGQGNTPTGVDVAVDLAGGASTPGGGSVAFEEITSGGDSALTAGADGPAPPAGFKLGEPATYYDVSTTAAFDGPVLVCINYAGIAYLDEPALRLFHLEEGEWVDRTVSLDADRDVICASVVHLSPFAIFEPSGPSLAGVTSVQVWVGLANSDSVGLRLDLKAELFIDSTSNLPIATGMASNVRGGSGHGNAVLVDVPLALTDGAVTLPPRQPLLLRVSARRTCAGGGHASGIARLWYNGVAIDTGKKRDTASRFGATIGEADVTYYLRAGWALATTPGASRLWVNRPVNSVAACPDRPYAPFGTWSVVP